MPDTVRSRQTIIGDSGPMIALSVVGLLELLPQLFERVVIPRAVWEEITIQGIDLPGAVEISRLKWLVVQSADSKLLESLTVLVDRGEAEAIALAMSEPGSMVLLDDAQARRVAERFGVSRIGTLGILRRAKKAQLIAAIKPLITQLQTNRIYLHQELIDAVLRDVGEFELRIPPHGGQ